jgi:hypothetical protein
MSHVTRRRNQTGSLTAEPENGRKPSQPMGGGCSLNEASLPNPYNEGIR